MTTEEHKQRHIELHAALDELIADYIQCANPTEVTKTPLINLMQWSYQQTLNPTENEH